MAGYIDTPQPRDVFQQHIEDEDICLRLLTMARNIYESYKAQLVRENGECAEMNKCVAFLATHKMVEWMLAYDDHTMFPMSDIDVAEDSNGNRRLRYLGVDVYTFVDTDDMSDFLLLLCKLPAPPYKQNGDRISGLPFMYHRDGVPRVVLRMSGGDSRSYNICPVCFHETPWLQPTCALPDTTMTVNEVGLIDEYLESFRRHDALCEEKEGVFDD